MTPAYSSIVVLTGAGISAESGIKTFRASDGLWENHRVEDVATPEAFQRDPALVQHFYNLRRKQLHSGIQPNAGHLALARFATTFQGQFTLITQNIDNLHELAGSSDVLHMHGELLKMHCTASGNIFDCESDITAADRCSCCNRTGNLRPHIVWFGEMPLHMDKIETRISHCDLFISIGTSGNVYPAAGFFQLAKEYGAHTVELNLEPSLNSKAFDDARYGPGTQVIPEYLEHLLSQIQRE